MQKLIELLILGSCIWIVVTFIVSLVNAYQGRVSKFLICCLVVTLGFIVATVIAITNS